MRTHWRAREELPGTPGTTWRVFKYVCNFNNDIFNNLCNSNSRKFIKVCLICFTIKSVACIHSNTDSSNMHKFKVFTEFHWLHMNMTLVSHEN